MSYVKVLQYFIKHCLLFVLFIVATSSQGLMLNLKDTNIKTLINTVSMATGKNFVVDPRVKGKVNVITNSDIDNDQLYHLFLTVLRIHGFIVVDGENVSQILPKNLTKSDSAPRSNDASDKLVTTVISVNSISASQILPVLKPLMSQYGHLGVYAPGNSLIVVDSQANIVRLKKILSKLDKTIDDDFEIIQLVHTPVTDISNIIKPLITNKNTKDENVNLIADKHNNQLIVSGSKSKRLKIRFLIAQLDKDQGDSGNIAVVYLKYANAKEILSTLQSIGKRTDEKNIKDANKIAAKSNIHADEATNSIIINGSNEVIKDVKNIIEKLDIRRAQVLIEAVIAEISTSDAKELGIQWLAKGGNAIGFVNFNNIIPLLIANAESPESLTVPQGATMFAGKIDDKKNGIGLIISALKSNGNANILSTPSIVTLDNESAEMVVGQEVPFITNAQLSSSNTNPFQNFERKDVGLSLKVKPQINDGSSIKLEIEQETSNVLPSSAGVASDIITSKRKIKTSVMVEDKQLLVLGGLINEEWRDTDSRIPILGDIPILGALFTHKTKSKEKRNLFVFIRPTILTDNKTIDKISEQKYKYIQAQKLMSHGNEDKDSKDENIYDISEILTPYQLNKNK